MHCSLRSSNHVGIPTKLVTRQYTRFRADISQLIFHMLMLASLGSFFFKSHIPSSVLIKWCWRIHVVHVEPDVTEDLCSSLLNVDAWLMSHKSLCWFTERLLGALDLFFFFFFLLQFSWFLLLSSPYSGILYGPLTEHHFKSMLSNFQHKARPWSGWSISESYRQGGRHLWGPRSWEPQAVPWGG